MLQHRVLVRRRLAFLGNAVFSALSGAAALVAGERLTETLGLGRGAIVPAVGGVLVSYSLMLLWVATREHFYRRMAMLIIGMDMAWVAGSAALSAAGGGLISGPGRILVAALAFPVAVFAVWQMWAIRPD